MQNHIKIVALGNMALGALGIVVAILFMLGFSVAGLASGELAGGLVLGSIGVIGGAFIAVYSLPQFIGGLGLLARKNWARYVLMVTSALSLFGFPIGTILGGYSLWVLTNNDTKMLTSGS